jgi:Ca2+-binding EF-hand superfamily protein
LRTFDENVFKESKPILNIYRQFDKDKDGYVSTQDFREKLKEMNIYNEKET